MTEPLKPNEFRCAMCEGIFTKGWSDEERKQELKDTFDVPEEECVTVCDVCYKEMGFGG